MSAQIIDFKAGSRNRFDIEFKLLPNDNGYQLVALTRTGELFLQSHGPDFSTAFWEGRALEFCLKHRVSFNCPIYEFIVKDEYRAK